MAADAPVRCPSCGEPVPAELGQHAPNLLTGSVNCPHCGAAVSLRDDDASSARGDAEPATAAPPGRPEGIDAFSGHGSVEEVAEELRRKPT